MRLGRELWRILQTSARGRHHHNSQTSLGGWLLFVHVKTLCVLVKEKSMTAVEVLWGDDSTKANIFIRHLLMNSSSFYRSVSHRRWPWTQYDLKQKSFSLISWFKMPFRAHSSGCWIDMKRGWKKKKKATGISLKEFHLSCWNDLSTLMGTEELRVFLLPDPFFLNQEGRVYPWTGHRNASQLFD